MHEPRAAAPARHRERGRGGDRLPALAGGGVHLAARACASTARRRTPSGIWPEVGTRRHDARPFDGFHLATTPRRAARRRERLMPALRSRSTAPATRSPPTARAHARADRANGARSKRAPAPPAPKAAPLFDKRGQLLPRERVARLLDPGVPFLELSTLAGWLQDDDDAERVGARRRHRSPASASSRGVRCMVVAERRRHRRRRDAADGPARSSCARRRSRSRTSCPSCTWSNAAGANLLRYRVESFVHGGALFRNLARLSAAGLPVITVVHGSWHRGRRLHAGPGRLRGDGARPLAAPSSPGRRC